MMQDTQLIALYEQNIGPYDPSHPAIRQSYETFKCGFKLSNDLKRKVLSDISIDCGTKSSTLTFNPLVDDCTQSTPARTQVRSEPSVHPARTAIAIRASSFKKTQEEAGLLQDFNKVVSDLIEAYDSFREADEAEREEAKRSFNKSWDKCHAEVVKVHNKIVDRKYRRGGKAGLRFHLGRGFFMNLPFEYLYSIHYPSDHESSISEPSENDDSDGSKRLRRIMKKLKSYALSANRGVVDNVTREKWQQKHAWDFVIRDRDERV